MELSLMKMTGIVLVIGGRISGLMLFVPFFSHSAVGARIKAALMVALTAVLYPVLSPTVQPPAPGRWPWVVASEILIGIALGIITNLVFEGVQLAGQIMSLQMGYSLVNILDPQTQVDTTVVAVFTHIMALLTFLALDVHHWILRLLVQSFTSIPPGLAEFGPAFTNFVLRTGGHILSIGIQVAAPVLSATIVADLLLGLLSKAAPQMPILFLGPSVKAMLSVALLAGALPYWPQLFSHLFERSLVLSDQALRLAR